MREDLPSWAEDDLDEPERRRTPGRPWLLVLAVVPWLVVLGIVLTGPSGPPAPASPEVGAGAVAGGNGAGTPTTPTDGHTSGGTDPDPPAPDREADPPVPDLDADLHAHAAGPPAVTSPHRAAADAGRTPDHAGDPATVAVALLVARAWLTDVGPRLEFANIRPHEDTYLEHGTVESVQHVGGHAVVTISAIVLERDGDVYGHARARRLAVPISTGDPPRPAGEPWWLADTVLEPAEPELTGVDDPDVLLALGESVGSLVPEVDELVEAGRTPDGWWVVQLTTHERPEDPVRVWLPPEAERPPPASGPADTDDTADTDDQEHP